MASRQVTTKDASAERCIMDVCSSMDKAIQAQQQDVADKQEAFEAAKTKLDNMRLLHTATTLMSEQ